MIGFTVSINGTNVSSMIERDSYQTWMTPVYSKKVTTLDGVDHVSVIRYKHGCSFSFNPLTAADTATVCALLLNAPVTLVFKSLQTNSSQTKTMTVDGVDASYLSRCLHGGLSWNSTEKLTFEEL